MNLPASRQIELLAAPDSNLRKALLTVPNVLPQWEGKLGILARKLAGTPMAVGNADGSQLLGVLDRNRAQANGVNELENGGVGADAKRKGKDGDDGKARTEAKKTKGVAKVLQK